MMSKFDMTVTQAHHLGGLIRDAAGSLLKGSKSNGCDTEAIRKLLVVSDFLEGKTQSPGSSRDKQGSAASESAQ